MAGVRTKILVLTDKEIADIQAALHSRCEAPIDARLDNHATATLEKVKRQRNGDFTRSELTRAAQVLLKGMKSHDP